jgi:hypothetical protein
MNHGFPRRDIVVEKVTAMENHVDIVFLSEAHDFIESLPAIITTGLVTLTVTDMAICSHENANGVRTCSRNSVSGDSIKSVCPPRVVERGAMRSNLEAVGASGGWN